MVRRLSRVGRDPVVLAILLSSLSVPFAAFALHDSARLFHGFPPNPPLTLEAAARLAVVAVLVAGVAGGSVGKLMARRRPVLGVALAAGTAWATAIVTLPIAASALGISYKVTWACISTCVEMNSDVPLSGLDAYVQSVTAVGPGTSITIGASILAMLMARSRQRVLSVGFALLGVVGFNFWSMLEAPAAAIALLVGIVIWGYPMISIQHREPRTVGGASAESVFRR